MLCLGTSVSTMSRVSYIRGSSNQAFHYAVTQAEAAPDEINERLKIRKITERSKSELKVQQV